MGVWDNVKKIMNVSADDFEEETVETAEPEQEREYFQEPVRKREPVKMFQAERKTKNINSSTNPQMQVVLVRPDRFDDVTAIADHLNAQKSVVLNLEAANRETSRRILDFLSGVAYANRGNIKKVANATYMIVSGAVDLSGEHMFDDMTDPTLY
ncbi:MAG: cell division protein SepF [Clostridia bacterium]|nr:cell division protein SepF [Clostridia bacterium]